MRGWSAVGMPMPVSATVKTTSAPRAWALTAIWPRASVYCVALSSKFCRTSARRRRSPATSGTPLKGVTEMAISFSAARVLDDDFEKAPAMLRIVHGAGEQGFREALNGGERGAKFVGNVGDEIAAHAFELAQLGDVVKHDDGAGSFAGAHRRDGGGEKMLAQRAGGDFSFHARLAG